ncbi:autotransporter domain-containing protein [Bradyrhizobium sp. Bra64]|uniref:autotransporter outer membrane beta-barrel domain-containing protein n=1 Tax=Bradyrhizobium sp. Bra64 TaxID=2926009 RepID=UPI002118CD73|nr:autotransporter outer membrane beta-barrel domain-containing protein [Bradyrhizobium sp. Bra64]
MNILRGVCGGLLLGLILIPLDAASAQPCQTTGTDQTCTNSLFLSAGAAGLSDLGTVTVANTSSGSIVGTGVSVVGIVANVDANVTNSGSISGVGTSSANGIETLRDGNVTNSGTISATGGMFGNAIVAGRNANITNSGTIFGSGGTSAAGISATAAANVVNSGLVSAFSLGGSAYGVLASSGTVTNSGTITATGFSGYGIRIFNTAQVTNSGTIFGNTAALQFGGSPDSLTVLPGSRIIGAINLGGGGDTVNFRGGNHNLTFDTLAGATVTGTTPFAVSGNQAAAVDLTPFASNWRTLTDFTRGVADALPVFSGSPGGGAAPLAFAGPDGASRFDDAFAAIPGLTSAYAGEAAVFKAPAMRYADGTTVWTRGFAGQRIQQQDGVLLRTANLFYGGMLGGDWQTRPDLRVGAFLGGGKTRTSIDLNQGALDSDLFFGGAYARYDIGQTFLHGAVQAGGSRNASARTVNNNLVAGGLETATASYNGWYVSPEATIGQRIGLGQLADAAYTLTPSFRLRYLYGAFDGYTEAGTTAPLTLGSQTVSTLEERGEAKLTRSVSFTPGDVLSASLTAGLLGTQRVGGSTISASLLGQAIPFATPGQASVWGGFGGAGLEWRSRSVTLYSAAEYLALSDRSNVVSGRAGLRVAF